ncbi:hypothetical protein K435DRAFT_856559 [Dendrothele bispora CBS 962.96]|uniref:Uncharacterized protein n=1 Tax=Dendrothele bispora (strain CBS 962.96) TaxID=1314807 RepID=A0A4S8M880_DENBC|nr:hypothetical protein K435DRAFT_856559 [Dendrothele bispora CBS 962.96]
MSRYTHPFVGVTPDPPPTDNTGGYRRFFVRELELDGRLVHQLRDAVQNVPDEETALGLLSVAVDTHDEVYAMSSDQANVVSIVTSIDTEMGSQTFNIRRVLAQVDNISSIVQRTHTLMQDMWDIPDVAKFYISHLVWTDLLIPLEREGNLTKDVIVSKASAKVKGHARTLNLSAYRSGDPFVVQRVDEFIETVYFKTCIMIFHMVSNSVNYEGRAINAARTLQDALIEKSPISRMFADQERNVVLITYTQMRALLREYNSDGQLHAPDELQYRAFTDVGKYMDGTVQVFGTDLFSPRWKTLCSEHVVEDALATF